MSDKNLKHEFDVYSMAVILMSRMEQDANKIAYNIENIQITVEENGIDPDSMDTEFLQEKLDILDEEIELLEGTISKFESQTTAEQRAALFEAPSPI